MDVVINRWERKEANMTRKQVIRFQLLVHCHLSGIRVTETDLECLTYIGVRGSIELRYLCNELVSAGLYTSSQSSRNSISILGDKGLLQKIGRPKKVVLADYMKIQTEGNILLEIKCLSREQRLVTV